jgi:uncharacterized protein (DUF362 family)/Pyruvate/2-oxoacid:ferredoxin oxidoreductase delta subunit
MVGLMPPSEVAVVRCKDYADADAAVRKALSLLGGLDIAKDDKVLIKPNLLIGRRPDDAVTTHPAVVEPVVGEVKRLGGQLTVGDSPGTWANKRLKDFLKVTGFKEISERQDFHLMRFGEEPPVPFVMEFGGKERTVFLEKTAVDADYIINMPKAKTHMVTILTGALKNMYGLIPGNEKQLIHKWANTIQPFAEAVAAINKACPADMVVADAVVGLEGNGPNYLGKSIRLGYIVAGRDPVAVDTVLARIMGIPLDKLVTVQVAKELGLGTTDYTLLGDEPETTKVRLPSQFIYRLWPVFQAGFLIPFTVPKPMCDDAACVRCGTCETNCPVKAITVSDRVRFDYDKCIRCLCCVELCPNACISPRFPWLLTQWLKH